MSFTSPTKADQYWSPASPAWRARRVFSPREAWKIEIDFESDRVRSKKRGLCRACLAASTRSSRSRSAVACGSAASSRAYRSAISRPPSGGLLSGCRREPCAGRRAGRTGPAPRAGRARGRGLGTWAPPAAGRFPAGLAGDKTGDQDQKRERRHRGIHLTGLEAAAGFRRSATGGPPLGARGSEGVPCRPRLASHGVAFCWRADPRTAPARGRRLAADPVEHHAPAGRSAAVEPEDELVEIGGRCAASTEPWWVPSSHRFTARRPDALRAAGCPGPPQRRGPLSG